MLLWIGCVFVSILVHELGHGLLAQRYSNCKEILLYTLGGLCFYSPEPRRPSHQLAITLAGPGAGFLLCIVFMMGASLVWGITPVEHLSLAAGIVGVRSIASDDALTSVAAKFLGRPVAWDLYYNMVFINLMWGLVNLLPILPLDGGRVSQTLLSLYDRSQAHRWSYIVSLLTSGILAAYFMSWPEPDLFLILMFGSLAFMSYQSLQAIHQTQVFHSSNDDWWRR